MLFGFIHILILHFNILPYVMDWNLATTYKQMHLDWFTQTMIAQTAGGAGTVHYLTAYDCFVLCNVAVCIHRLYFFTAIAAHIAQPMLSKWVKGLGQSGSIVCPLLGHKFISTYSITRLYFFFAAPVAQVAQSLNSIGWATWDSPGSNKEIQSGYHLWTTPWRLMCPAL